MPPVLKIGTLLFAPNPEALRLVLDIPKDVDGRIRVVPITRFEDPRDDLDCKIEAHELPGIRGRHCVRYPDNSLGYVREINAAVRAGFLEVVGCASDEVMERILRVAQTKMGPDIVPMFAQPNK